MIPMRIFNDVQFHEYIAIKKNNLYSEISSEDRDIMLNLDETVYSKTLIEKHIIPKLAIDFPQKIVQSNEAEIPIQRDPFRAHRTHIVTYRIPYQGNKELLKIQPTSHFSSHPVTDICDEYISFDIIDYNNSYKNVELQANTIIGAIQELYNNLHYNISDYNSSLKNLIIDKIRSRKNEILKQKNLMKSLGIPIQPSQTIPDSFTLPIETKKLMVEKPNIPTKYVPEPTVSDEIYQSILNIFFDFGIAMEKHPSIYLNKKEEMLRDLFIMMLSPHFQSASAETFNKKGKTDILITHENHNAFIAELKFWSGKKKHQETIDQILKYLTWRDSKAAIIYFIRKHTINSVLTDIEAITPSHPCYVDLENKSPSIFYYNFHIPEDNTRGVKLAILIFHFPNDKAII